MLIKLFVENKIMSKIKIDVEKQYIKTKKKEGTNF